MQYHYVVGYDTETNKWFVEPDESAYFPDGHIFDLKAANETGYGWTYPEEDSTEEAIDNALYKTLEYIMVKMPTLEDE